MRNLGSEIILVPLPHSSIILSSNVQAGNIQHLSVLTEIKIGRLTAHYCPQVWTKTLNALEHLRKHHIDLVAKCSFMISVRVLVLLPEKTGFINADIIGFTRNMS